MFVALVFGSATLLGFLQGGETSDPRFMAGRGSSEQSQGDGASINGLSASRALDRKPVILANGAREGTSDGSAEASNAPLGDELQAVADSLPRSRGSLVPFDPDSIEKPDGVAPKQLRDVDGGLVQWYGESDSRGAEEGLWIKWKDGVLSECRQYRSGELIGPSLKFHPDGSVASYNPSFKEGGVEGPGYAWYLDGNRKYAITFSGSIANGPAVYWNRNGVIDAERTGHYRDGKRVR